MLSHRIDDKRTVPTSCTAGCPTAELAGPYLLPPIHFACTTWFRYQNNDYMLPADARTRDHHIVGLEIDCALCRGVRKYGWTATRQQQRAHSAVLLFYPTMQTHCRRPQRSCELRPDVCQSMRWCHCQDDRLVARLAVILALLNKVRGGKAANASRILIIIQDMSAIYYAPPTLLRVGWGRIGMGGRGGKVGPTGGRDGRGRDVTRGCGTSGGDGTKVGV